MKAEVNNETKERFFAQYWGQIAIDHNKSINIWNGLVDLEGWCLELTPLSMITDEDANFIANSRYGQGNKLHQPEGWVRHNIVEIACESYFSDYLRSKGYALPYLGISVEQQVGAGWIKLKEGSNVPHL